MKFLISLVFLPAIFLLVRGDNFPIDENEVYEDVAKSGDEGYRLPEVLDPINILVEMTPYFEATVDKEIWTFDGSVIIQMQALEDVTGSFVIHENVKTIVAVRVIDQNNVTVADTYERLTKYQFLQINLKSGYTLSKGQNYTMNVEYVGNINETPLSRGVFRGYHRDIYTGDLHHYVATHLQPTHSRQAFPCFDEPGFKSKFTIIVNRPCNFADTYSNMPASYRSECNIESNRVREVFYATPRMSAYLVSIHISERFTVIADNHDPERPYAIHARIDADGQGEWALEVGMKLTEWFERYLDIPYYKMGENMKNDQLASPDWASGATENWGLVTYRESRLLYEEGETNAIDKMQIGTITAHELAHKWFGNLITARWWDNVWVNEGFASYFEYFAMEGVHKEMELEDQFNLLYVQNALSTDSAANTRALRHSVNTPDEVSGHFTGISYSKGASFLMMLNHFLSPQTFQKALKYFLLDRQYKYALPEHIYAAFARAVEEDNALANYNYNNITRFMEIWVDEPGYPVINVEVDHREDKIHLEQERFILSSPPPTTTNQIWHIPYTVATKSRSNFDNRRANGVMTTKDFTLDENLNDDTWVILNIKQSGIYRVNYDKKNWELIAEALENNRESIHYLNRAQIVDDIFAFMRSERMTYRDGFKILQFLRKETNFYVWYPAITGFNFLKGRLAHMERNIMDFETILLEFLEEVMKDLGFDEGSEDGSEDNFIRIRNRFSIMSLACSIRHKGCVDHAVETFKDFVENQESVNPNLRRHVYCSALLANGDAYWDHLREHFDSINNQADEVVTLRALGCTRSQSRVNRFLELVLTEAVRPQDRTNAFSFLYSDARFSSLSAKYALDFIKRNHTRIRTAVFGSSRFGSVLSNLASNLDEEGLVEMESWLTSFEEPILEHQSALNAIQTSRNNKAWGAKHADEILSAMRGNAVTLIPTTISLLTAIVMFLLK